MRQRLRLLPVVVLLLGTIALGVASAASGQDATPPPVPSLPPFEIAPGVTAEALAFVPGQEAPALYRVTFAPGVTYEITPAPEISLIYQETGALTFTLDAPVTVTRAGATDEPREAVGAGTEFTLETGDYMVFPPLGAGEARNDSEEEVSVVVASILPADGMATPAA